MPDETHPTSDATDDNAEQVAPSTLFLEMMRQAAAQNHEEEPNLESLSFVSDPDFLKDLDLPLDDAPDASSQIDLSRTRPEQISTQPSPSLAPAGDEAMEQDHSEAAAPVIKRPRVPTYPVPPSVDQETEAREQRHAAAMKAQRVRRVRRRRERRRQRRMGAIGGFVSTLLVGLVAAGLASTIFTWFTSPDFIQQEVASGLQIADATNAVALAAPTAVVTPNWLQHIGIVSGHRGPENDPGAICEDGLTEAEINFEVALLVVQGLREMGYTVDLLDEFDPRLDDYHAAALVSIHSNDCRDYGETVSGFLVARASARPPGGLDDYLAECIGSTYGYATQLERRFSLTVDMTDYHTFREIHPLTPAAILELGFMREDRGLLTEQQDVLARGIIEGVLCFINRTNPLTLPSAPTSEASPASPEV